jgi:hypothetical protein
MVAAVTVLNFRWPKRAPPGPSAEDPVHLARARLREVITDRNAARSVHATARTHLERVEQIEVSAAALIKESLETARTARAARQDLLALHLARGEDAPADADAELVARERDQLASVRDARLRLRSAEQALPDLESKVHDAQLALSLAEERVRDAAKLVVIETVRAITAHGEQLAAQLTELYRLLAATSELCGDVFAPPLVRMRFGPELLEDHIGSLNASRARLLDDAEAATFNV